MPESNTISPLRAEFLRLAAMHSLVPVYRTLTADLETPVSAFLRLAADEPKSFLLESVEGGEKVGRYTFIGIRPYRTILARGSSLSIEERGKTRKFQGDVFALLKEMLAGQTPARIAGLPPFTSGAVGFFAYDVVRHIERLPELAKDDLNVPDACLMFFDEVLAFDHVRKQIQLIVTADLSRQNRLPRIRTRSRGWAGWKSAWRGLFPNNEARRRAANSPSPAIRGRRTIWQRSPGSRNTLPPAMFFKPCFRSVLK